MANIASVPGGPQSPDSQASFPSIHAISSGPTLLAHMSRTTGASRFANAAAERRHSGRDADRRACEPAIVGNFGGGRFFEYTTHGDTITVAARLEAANKQLGTRICASATIARKVGSRLGKPWSASPCTADVRGEIARGHCVFASVRTGDNL